MSLYYFLTAFVASIAYAMVFELHGRTLIMTSLGGGISWLIYKWMSAISGIDELVPYLIATLVVSFYSELMARKMKKPATLFLIVAMLPLVPGQGIYDTMLAFVNGDSSLGMQRGSRTLAITGTLALGMLLASTIFRIIMRGITERAKKETKH